MYISMKSHKVCLFPRLRRVGVRILKLVSILPEALFALFAGKGHIYALLQRVCLFLGMTLCAVEPFSAAWRADRNLGVEDVFTVRGCFVNMK